MLSSSDDTRPTMLPISKSTRGKSLARSHKTDQKLIHGTIISITDLENTTKLGGNRVVQNVLTTIHLTSLLIAISVLGLHTHIAGRWHSHSIAGYHWRIHLSEAQKSGFGFAFSHDTTTALCSALGNAVCGFQPSKSHGGWTFHMYIGAFMGLGGSYRSCDNTLPSYAEGTMYIKEGRWGWPWRARRLGNNKA